MNSSNYIKALLVFFSTLAVAGCASTGADNAPGVVQAIRIGDDILTCPDLQAQIRYADQVVAKLDKEINRSKMLARTSDAAGAINSYLGKSSLLNSISAGFSRDAVADKREVRDSHQRRRATLLQQYMHKQCSLTAQRS